MIESFGIGFELALISHQLLMPCPQLFDILLRQITAGDILAHLADRFDKVGKRGFDLENILWNFKTFFHFRKRFGRFGCRFRNLFGCIVLCRCCSGRAAFG